MTRLSNPSPCTGKKGRKKMRKQAKGLFGFVLILVMLATLLSSCGLYEDDPPATPAASTSASASGSAAASEPAGEPTAASPELAATWSEFSTPREITITWFEQGWTGMEKDLDIITPEIQKRTNLLMNYEAMTVPTGDDYTQKLNLMVSSNDVPDIFFGGSDSYTRTIYEKLGQNNRLWDLTDIVKDYELLYELVYPELNLYKTKDKKNYFIPTQTGRGNELLKEAPHGLFVRKDYLDQLGMDYPTTPEAFAEYLRRSVAEITTNGERGFGLVLGENLGGLEQLYQPFYPMLGSRDSYSLPFDLNDNYRIRNYEYTDSPELMAAAKYVHSLVKEGLVDREALTIKQAQVQEKLSSGRAAAATAPWWDINAFSDNAKQTVPDLMFVANPHIYASKEIEASRSIPWTNWVGCWSSLIFDKGVPEESVRHLLAVMDYLTTEEGQLLVQAGIEGETYQWNSEGKYEFTPEFKAKTNDLDWNKSAAYGVFYYSQLVFNVPAITDKQATPPSLIREDNRIGWENRKSDRDLYRADMKPTKDYYFLPGEVESQKFPAIIDAKREFWAKVMAAKSDAEVGELVKDWAKTCKNLGIDEIIAERQAYIDNFEMID